MKLLKGLLVASLATSLTMFSGCSDDDDDSNPTETQFDMLTAVTDAGLAGWTTGWVKDVPDVYNNLANRYVIDLRSATDYAAGHIAGAVNSTMANVVTTAEGANGKTIAVVCYSGQNAAFATMALRMSGYDDAYSIKFGMAAWNQTYAGTWDTKVSDALFSTFVTTASPALPEFDAPTLSGSFGTGEDVMEARISAVLSEGLRMKTAADVVAGAADFNVLNYWSEADYLSMGHLPGAYQLTPGTLFSDQNLSAFDPDGDNVLYCYTGQTSSFMSFYLRTLGYTVYSLSYGANSMIHDHMTASKWTVGGTDYNYPVVTN